MMKVPQEVKDGMLLALVDSMRVVRRNQLETFVRGEAEGKADGTIVTTADKASERVGKDALRRIGSVAIHGEETGAEGDGDEKILIYLDPLDGSMPYAIGAGTSTVIVAAVEKATGEVLHCLVGEPQSHRIWRADREGPCEVNMNTPDLYKKMSGGAHRPPWRQVRACSDLLGRKSRVLLDSYPGFLKGDRMILSNGQLDRLHTFIQQSSGLLMFGSNGLHHALVANGGKGAVGAITTAIGGPWDVCPTLLVEAAGGFVRAFFVGSNRTLEEKDPHVVGSYDIVISGNSKETTDTLAGYLGILFKGD